MFGSPLTVGMPQSIGGVEAGMSSLSGTAGLAGAPGLAGANMRPSHGRDGVPDPAPARAPKSMCTRRLMAPSEPFATPAGSPVCAAARVGMHPTLSKTAAPKARAELRMIGLPDRS